MGKSFNRTWVKCFIGIVVAVTLVFGNMTVGEAASNQASKVTTKSKATIVKISKPVDINRYWAKKQVDDWVSKGTVPWYKGNLFKPNQAITVSEYAGIVNKVFGLTGKAQIKLSGKTNSKITRDAAAKALAAVLKMDASTSRDLLNVGPTSKSFLSKYPKVAMTRGEAIAVLSKAVGTIYSSGTNGPAKGIQTISGNVSINKPGVSLRNTAITGNLYLAEGIGKGNCTLNNVTVKGKTIVSGGGVNSIVVINSSLGAVLVNVPDGSNVRIVTQGTSSVGQVQCQSAAILQESGTGDGFSTVLVSVPAGAGISLQGAFSNVELSSPSNLQMISGSIGELNIAQSASGSSIVIANGAEVQRMQLNAGANVTGSGTINSATVNAAGVSIQQPVTNLTVITGVTASIGGSNVIGTATPTQIPTPSTTTNTTNNTTNNPITGGGGGTTNITAITVSGIETTNTFGYFKFSTSAVTTADELAGKIKANGVICTSFQKRSQGADGTAWKCGITSPAYDTSYAITAVSPYTISGTSTVSWSSTTAAPAVTNVTAADNGDAGNGSDMNVSFTIPSGENTKIASYRILVVKSGNAGSFNLISANSVSSGNYTVVAKTGSNISTALSSTAKDVDGSAITNGVAYRVFVLSVADGTNAAVNGLSSASSDITLTGSGGGGGGGGGDSIPPIFTATYPKAGTISQLSTTLLVKTNESGNAYYVCLPDGATAPSAAQVKAGKAADDTNAALSGSCTLTANNEASTLITGLTIATSYDIYVVAEDQTHNLQSNPSLVGVTTNSDASTATVTGPANMTRRDSISLSISGAKDITGTDLSGDIAVTVTSDKDGQVYSGNVTFAAGAGSPSITTADTNTLGVHVLTVAITGVTQSKTVNVTIADSAITAGQCSVTIDQELRRGRTRTVTVALKDAAGNPLANTSKNMNVLVAATNADLTTTESYLVNGSAVGGATQNYTVPMANTATNADGEYSFTVQLPAGMDLNDGLSVQVTQNQTSKTVGSPFTYYAQDHSAATVTGPANMTRRDSISLSISGAKDITGTDLSGDTAVTVTSDKDGQVYSGNVTFTAGAGTLSVATTDTNTLGAHVLTIVITGVTQSKTANVTVADSAITANKCTVTIDQALNKGTTSTVTVTLRDANDNPLASTSKNMNVLVTITDTDLATTESYVVNGSSVEGAGSHTVAMANTTTDTNGQYSFTVQLPDTIDGGDGLSIQVTQNQISKTIGIPNTYSEPL
ncbi:MAG: beta strand repeat-containing protein [Ignavibacteriales bacterium]